MSLHETKLLTTFSLQKDEGGLQFYRRLSAANGMLGWKELARISEVSGSRSALFNHPEHVSRMLGIESAACHMASAREELTLSWRGLRRSGFDAICPHCLKESAHLRQSWEHVYMVACPKHKTLLVDRCGACGIRLSDQREHLEVCACGHNLLESQPKPATQTQLWVSSVIASGNVNGLPGFPDLQDVPVELFALLVRTFCQLYDPAFSVTRENATAPKAVLEAIEFLRPLEQLLTQWPRGFEDHIRERIDLSPQGGRTLNTRLGKWYLRIKEVASEGPLGVFLEVIHNVAANDFSSVLALDHVCGLVGRSRSHLMLPDAAARIGVHWSTLRKAVEAGEVECIKRPYANRGDAREIPVAEVERVILARKGWIKESAARELTGVPEHVFKELVQAGLVVSDGSARSNIRRGSPIEASSIERLLALLKDGTRRDASDDEARVRLNELEIRRLGDKQAMARLFAAIASGDIRPLNVAETVGDFEFLESDVQTFFSSRSTEAGLTIQALSEATGWKWESISHWVNEGLLESVPGVLRGQPCRVVMPEHLVRFSQTYVTLSSLAHSIGARPSELLERLGSVKVFGGKPLPSGAMRGGLVRLADLATAALQPGLVRGAA
ncbi:TniQ family protein [Calothrix sp. FACHB-1219]|uniref:TniQ family protein n=1 Tax=Calothrix sp. FACHB-1219 TaxID=2692778 RepID=UPI001683E157|nr:TniQ family protein [Calothrix sp. FACHB-1219]